MLSSIITTGVLLAVLQALPTVAIPTVANRDASPLDGYGIEELTWEVETTPGGPSVNITGTVEHVVEELGKINPTFVSDFGIENPDNSSAVDAPIEARAYYLKEWYCDVFGLAKLEAIQAGLVYLNGVPGKPTNGPGPGNCGRVSCSHSAAIYWCNDNTVSKTIDTFGYISGAAQTIINKCGITPQITPLGVFDYVKGQVFMTDNWNVIIKYDKC
ncbi:hypothetical protein B0T20DRAFT_398457 [Sordaria brevicollis]|uniref:Uncharacterized protein n=1 Tax=Sordaria brevicollis TaxID=83679 RepID=A0AAE0UGG8_SORBR|nr:hypothetical protein B0T20DRAFT_398457 [Sordaria brevicollis]